MDCTALLKRSEQQLIAGNVTTADAAANLIDCFPDVCEQVFGDAGFDLAGSGVYLSIILQIALFFCFGTLQSYLSQCVPARVSTRTKLIIARFQDVHDTVYSTGCFFSLALIVTCFVRATQGNVGGLEKSVIRDILDGQQMLQNLMIANHWVQKTPSNIKRSARSWGMGPVYLASQMIIIFGRKIEKRLGQIPATGAEMAPKLCSSLYDYPHLHPAAATSNSWSPVLVGIALGIFLLVAGVGLSILAPRFWALLTKVLGSRAVLGTCSVFFSTICLLSSSLCIIHLHLTRKDLEGLPVWDLAQVCALAIWLRPAWHIVLATLSVLGPDPSATEVGLVGKLVKMLYSANFEEPSVGVDEAEKSNKDKKEQTSSELPEKPSQSPLPIDPAKEYDEKAQLVDFTEERPRSPSPGQMV